MELGVAREIEEAQLVCFAPATEGRMRALERSRLASLDDVPEDLQGLDDTMADTYFCNFSLFQSMPDSWAIKQLFPVLPIHRLHHSNQ